MEDVLERWRSEKTAAYLSTAVAANEPDPRRAKLFRKMAEDFKNAAREKKVDITLSNAFAFGGTNAVIALGKI